MTCSCPITCAFRWQDDPRPSIFVHDSAYAPKGESGLSMREIQSATISRRTQQEGKSPGTMRGLSDAADARINATELHQRRAKSNGMNHAGAKR